MTRFRSRGMALRPVHRIKHVIDSQQSTPLNVPWVTDIIKTVDAPVITAVNEVETGSKTYGIYLKVVVATDNANTGVVPNVYLAIFKNPAHVLATPAINSIGNDDTKKYVLHQEMSMLQNISDGNPTVIFNGVIKIPKGYVRNGPNDRLELIVLVPGIATQMCMQAHYKEFR